MNNARDARSGHGGAGTSWITTPNDVAELLREERPWESERDDTTGSILITINLSRSQVRAGARCAVQKAPRDCAPGAAEHEETVVDNTCTAIGDVGSSLESEEQGDSHCLVCVSRCNTANCLGGTATPATVIKQDPTPQSSYISFAIFQSLFFRSVFFVVLNHPPEDCLRIWSRVTHSGTWGRQM